MRTRNHYKQKLDRPLVLLLIGTLIAVFWFQLPKLTDPYKVAEDFRSFYWMNKFQEPGLYPNDQLRGSTYRRINLPWDQDVPIYLPSLGYGLLFYAASFFVSPLLFSKILPFLLGLTTVWYLYQYGKSLQDTRIGISLAVGFLSINLISPTSTTILSGFQRAFALPLMIALLYHLHQKQFTTSAIVIVASALIYPPIFLLASGTWAFVALLHVRYHPRLWHKENLKVIIPLVVAIALSTVTLLPVVWPRLTRALPSKPQETVSSHAQPTYNHLWERPKYSKEGRNPLFTLFPILGRGGLFNKALDMIYAFVLSILSSAFYLSAREKQTIHLPSEVLGVLIASLFLFVLSWLAIYFTDSFLLYLPSRYTRVGLSLFPLLFVSLNIQSGLKATARIIHRNSRKMIWAIALIEIAAFGLMLRLPKERTTIMGVDMKWAFILTSGLLIILAAISVRNSSKQQASSPDREKTDRILYRTLMLVGLLVPWGLYGRWVNGISTLNPPESERELLEYLRTLPKDVLIAGDPCGLDNVPLFARRQILFSCEKPSSDETLVWQSLKAYYAQETTTVLNFCDNYNVDYLVVNSQAYREENLDWVFYEPYNARMLAILEEVDHFALAQTREGTTVFQSEPFQVLPCDERLLAEQ
jgi:hypothetical protein